MNDLKGEDGKEKQPPAAQEPNRFNKLLASVPPQYKAAVIAVGIGFLSVALSIILRIIEAQIAGKIVLSEKGPVPNFASFLFMEYAAVGSDLVVVAFSLLVGAWVATRTNDVKAAKISGPVLLLLVLALATIAAKGMSDKVVEKYEKELAPSISDAVLKFTTIQSTCEQAAKAVSNQSEPPDSLKVAAACDGQRQAKRYQIFLPVILGAITIFVAAIGLTRQ